MAAKNKKKKVIKKCVKNAPKKSPLKKEKNRYIPRPKNYAELMRRTRDYHSYTFKLPRAQATKADLKKARDSKAIRTMWETGQYTAEQIQQQIKRKAIDYNIDRKLSPQQKTAITKQWYGTKHQTGLQNAIKHVETNEAQFVPVNHANRRKYLKRMKRTNKGIFVFESNVEITVVGRGRDFRLKIDRKRKREKGEQIFKRREMFFPFPKNVIIPDYVAMLYDKYKPNSVAIGVMSAHGNASYSNISGLDYVWETIESMKNKYKSHPFSGVYFYWF